VLHKEEVGDRAQAIKPLPIEKPYALSAGKSVYPTR
jgi:hypothetical protein